MSETNWRPGLLLWTTCPLCMGNGCEDCDGGGDYGPVNPEALAREFHIAYERLAPSYGYKTREASAVDWADVPENNRELMIATCTEVLGRLQNVGDPEPQRPELREFRGIKNVMKAWDDGWMVVAATVQGVEWVALMTRATR